MKSVAIIGAGPAGSLAALLLARAGIPVTLIEQHRFPRDKVCGECLSALGIEVLDRIGLRAPLLRLGPIRLTRASLFSGDGSRANLPLPREMWGISRIALDPFLLNAAAEAGACILQPARLENGHLVRNLQTNQLRPLAVDLVIDATGKAPASTNDLGLKAHFAHVEAPPNTIELFGVRGHYGGIAPIEGGRWNVAFSVPQSRVRQHRGNLEGLFDSIVMENLALQRQMRRAVRISNWLTSPLPRFGVRREWPHGEIPIGNAAAAIEPIGGEGMGLALRSAELAAECVIDAFARHCEPDVEKLRRNYRNLWRLRRLACRAAALAVSSPWVCRMVIPFVDSEDDLTAAALRALGKA